MRPPDHAHRRALLALASVALFCVPLIAAAQSPGFSFVAIGDTGDSGVVLDRNGAGIESLRLQLQNTNTPLRLLLFVGDNFYPNGLTDPAPHWQILRDAVLRPFLPTFAALGPNRIHAIPGNHDYYCANILGIPYGYCGEGNRREAAISAWTYHYYNPALIRVPMTEGSADSVDFILFDSSYLLARPIAFWGPPLDTLERLLRRSAAAPSVRWRIMATHHSPFSIGEHAGWRHWLPERGRVGYIGNCWSDRQDPFRYVYQFFSPQDMCDPRYRRYIDSLQAVIQRGGAKIQLLMAGHDHSLQLIYEKDRACELCPDVYVITGAGSKRDRVKSPAPPREYSRPRNDPVAQGRSVGGFVSGIFRDGRLVLEFRGEPDERPMDMGAGTTAFVLDQTGAIVRGEAGGGGSE